MPTWREVWNARGLSGHEGDATSEPLEVALRLDGYDTAMANGLTPKSMRDLSVAWGKRVALTPGDSMYEVGCGSGAFLAAATEVHGISRLGGSDYSQSLITSGRMLFPWLDLEVREGSQVPPEPTYTHVTCVGAFMYFSDLEYAATVVDRMIAKSVRTVSILDVPDLSDKERSESFRQRRYSGTVYQERYRGLDHLYFDRTWFLNHFARSAWRVVTADQEIEGYSNSKFRFNVFAERLDQNLDDRSAGQ